MSLVRQENNRVKQEIILYTERHPYLIRNKIMKVLKEGKYKIVSVSMNEERKADSKWYNAFVVYEEIV